MMVGSLLGLVGIAAGIKVGYALIGPDLSEQAWSSKAKYRNENTSLRLGFQEGMSFPEEFFLDATGSTRPFSELFRSPHTALLFADLACDKCNQMINFWDEAILPKYVDRVRLVICLDLMAEANNPSIADRLGGNEVIWYDKTLFETAYDLHIAPSLVVVDGNGRTEFTLVGFGREQRQFLDSFSF
jgi:hypothetical protein